MCCKVILITVVVMMVVFHQGFALRCYECFSRHSWEDCDKTSTMINCKSKNPSCMKVRYRVVSKDDNKEGWLYVKRCFGNETEKCHNETACPAMNNMDIYIRIIDCDISCCRDKDFCNARTTAIPPPRTTTSGTTTLGTRLKQDFSFQMVTMVTSISLAFFSTLI